VLKENISAAQKKKAKSSVSRHGQKGLQKAARRESVSEIVKRISGRSYDVYRDIFLENLGPSIRAYLTDNRTHKRLIFDTSLNASEEIILNFIKTNYDNPFMDWAGSQDRLRVEDLGYSVPDLLPIIEDCYRKL
jgi:hypothetical protein